MLDKRCWGVYWLVETMNVMLLETLMKMLVKKVVVKMLQKVVVRGRCDQAECRQPAPILIRPLPADTAPLGHGAHTRHTATGHNMQYPAHSGHRC